MTRIRVMHFRREVPTGGGPESLIVDIARHLDRTRFDLTVTVFGPPGAGAEHRSPLLDALRNTGTQTFVLPARHRLDRRPATDLARLLDDQRIDILHAHDHRSNLIAFLATRRRATVRVATLHQPLRRYWWLLHWELLDEWVWRHFERAVPVAAAIGEEVLAKHPELAGRVTPVLNGVDLTRFCPGGAREKVRAEFGIPDSATLCVTIGRFLPDKGLNYLLEAARRMLDVRKDVYWLLAGRGPLEQELRRQAADLRVTDRVIFAGFRTDVRDLLAAGDIMVVSSTCEGCSVAILEAMACARPVVATRVGGTPEIIEDGMNGVIIEPRRPDEIARAVMQLADAPERRNRLSQTAEQHVREHFSIQRMVRRYEQIYTDLVTPPST